ncbi:MAG: hypothetical protein HYY93_06285 [Planctomycetes bacterium]|nr:hypothetical protein [Planctomycetota bacterium]
MRVRYEVKDASGTLVRTLLRTVTVPGLPPGSPATARVEMDVAVSFDGRDAAGALLADRACSVTISSDFYRVTAQNATLLGSSEPLGLRPPDSAIVRDPRSAIGADYSESALTGALQTAGIDPASGRLTVNGADVTASALFGPAGVTFTPADRLPQGPVTVTLTIADLVGNVSSVAWSFVVRTVDPDRTTVVASPAMVPADGLATSTITVTPRDADGVTIGAGLAVVIAAAPANPEAPSSPPPSGGRIEGPVEDHGDGTYSAVLSASSIGGIVELRATVEGIAITQAASVTYTPSLSRALAAGQPYDATALRLAAGAPVTLLGTGLDPDPSRNRVRFTVGETTLDAPVEVGAVELGAQAPSGSVTARLPSALPAGTGAVALVVNGAASPEALPIEHVGPVTFAKTQGDDQRGPIGTPATLPLQVRLTDASGAPIPGEFLRAVSVRGGGFSEALSPAAAAEFRADSDGRVTIGLPTLRAGENVVTASCLGLETTFRLIGGSRRIVDEVLFPEGESPIGLAGPVACACAANGRLYVLRKSPPGVMALDTATNTIVAEEALPSAATAPASIVALPDGSALAVGVPETVVKSVDGKSFVLVPAKLIFVDPETLGEVALLDLAPKAAVDLLVASGTTILALRPSGSLLTVVDASTRTLRASLLTPEGIPGFRFVASLPGGATAWVGGMTSSGKPMLWSLDLLTLTLEGGALTNHVAGLGVLSPDGTRLYARREEMAGIDVLDLPSRSIVEKISFAGRNLSSVLLSSTHDGKRLLVPSQNDGLVEVLDTDPSSPTYHTVLGHVEVGTPTRQVAVTSDDLFGYALSFSNLTLTQFALGVDPGGGTPPYTVLSKASLGATPQRVAFAEDAGWIWVTLEPSKNADGSVTQFGGAGAHDRPQSCPGCSGDGDVRDPGQGRGGDRDGGPPGRGVRSADLRRIDGGRDRRHSVLGRDASDGRFAGRRAAVPSDVHPPGRPHPGDHGPDLPCGENARLAWSRQARCLRTVARGRPAVREHPHGGPHRPLDGEADLHP